MCVHVCCEFKGTCTSSRPESVCRGRDLRGLAHVNPPTRGGLNCGCRHWLKSSQEGVDVGTRVIFHSSGLGSGDTTLPPHPTPRTDLERLLYPEDGLSDGSVKRQGAGPYDLLSPRSQRGPRPCPGASCVPALASLISQGHPSGSHEEGSFADFRGLDSSPSPLWRNVRSALSSLPLRASLQHDLLLPGCSRRPRGPEVMGSTSPLPDGPPDGVMHPTPLPQGPREGGTLSSLSHQGPCTSLGASKAHAGWLAGWTS